MEATPILEVNRLRCLRKDEVLFQDISFTLTSGAVLFVEGPNGSGKSSLLRILVGLATPETGSIHWCGKPIHAWRHGYSEKLHYISHHNGIKLGLTVRENLQLLSHLSLAPIANPTEALHSLRLSSQEHTLARFLSAGQKRRLALAKLFYLPKPLWILDEPLTALDADTQALFLSALQTHLQQGGMAVISSHHAMHLAINNEHYLRLGAC